MPIFPTTGILLISLSTAALFGPLEPAASGSAEAASAAVVLQIVRDMGAAYLRASRQAGRGSEGRQIVEAIERQMVASAGPDRVELETLATRLRERVATPPEMASARALASAIRSWLSECRSAGEETLVERIRNEAEAIRGGGSAEVLPWRVLADQAAEALDVRLASFAARDAEWRRYVQWQGLRDQASGLADPDGQLLRKVARRLDAAAPLVRQTSFEQAARSVDKAADRLFAEQTSLDDHAERLASLADALQAHRASPDVQSARSVSEALWWLEERGLSRGAVADVRRGWVRPNVALRLSREFLESAVGQSFREQVPSDERILGTRYVGRSTVEGQTSLELNPSFGRMELDLIYHGTIRSRSRGYSGPASLVSDATTQVAARKRMIVAQDGIRAPQAVAQAATRSRILEFSWGRMLGRRMALDEAYAKKPATERIVAERAARASEQALNRSSRKLFQPWQERYLHEIRRPLFEHGLFPRPFHLACSDQAALVAATLAAADQLAAQDDPPAINERADLSLRLHESLINNLAGRLLSGRTLQEPQVEAAFERWLGSAPEGVRTVDPTRTWSVMLQDHEPLVVKIRADEMSIEIRAAGFRVGNDDYPGMWITANYRLSGDVPRRMVRSEPLQIVPGGSDVISRRRTGGRQQALRTMVRKRFEPLFPADSSLESLPTPEPWRAKGRLKVERLDLDNGWLAVDSKWQSGEPSPAVRTASQPLHDQQTGGL